MPRRFIIRLGDTTSHGGRVEEGSANDRMNGRAVACVGHKVSCPKCGGSHAILPDLPGAAQLPRLDGVPLAVEGMRTACGATLIASQQSFSVDDADALASSPPVAPPPPAGRHTLCLACLKAAAGNSASLVVRGPA